MGTQSWSRRPSPLPLLEACHKKVAVRLRSPVQEKVEAMDADKTVRCDHEWGRLEEVVVGVMPRNDFVVPRFTIDMNWMPPSFEAMCRTHGGRRLIHVDPDLAIAMERQVEAFAVLLADLGVTVHRVEALAPPASTYLTPEAEGAQLFPRDGIVVIGNRVIELNMQMIWRRREVLGFSVLLDRLYTERDFLWIAAPKSNPIPAALDNRSKFLAGGDILLNGSEIYVGCSGNASNRPGIDWLRRTLGPEYAVHEIRLTPRTLHLDCAMSLVAPGLGLLDRAAFVDPLPESLQAVDWIEVTPEEAEQVGCNVCVLDAQRLVIASQQIRIRRALEAHGIQTFAIDYDAVTALGGSLRCSHHPILRVSG